MSVPEFQNFMLPILNVFNDKKIHTIKECKEMIIKYFLLTEDDVKEVVPSGKQTLVENRVYWSLTYLKKSLLIETITRGKYKITERGIDLLKTNPERIDIKLLSQYKEYRIFSNQEEDTDSITEIDKKEENEIDTPEDSIDKLYKKINNKLADDLLELILEKDGYYFERLVLDVLVKMGYGNLRDNAKIVTKKSNDGGIDGIINQDKLGLDKIYVQAKRWKDGMVGRPELQKFVGALAGQGARKGIFITTSSFSKEALEYKPRNETSIILIDGQKLVDLMYEYNIGVTVEKHFEIKRLDSDYFDSI